MNRGNIFVLMTSKALCGFEHLDSEVIFIHFGLKGYSTSIECIEIFILGAINCRFFILEDSLKTVTSLSKKVRPPFAWFFSARIAFWLSVR